MIDYKANTVQILFRALTETFTSKVHPGSVTKGSQGTSKTFSTAKGHMRALKGTVPSGKRSERTLSSKQCYTAV